MDPFDPLTEIINSGQAFSSLIDLERILWVMIGFFFIGAISTSITNSMRNKNWLTKKSFFFLKSTKHKEAPPQELSSEDK